jgi:hypothetical protein
MFSELVLMKVGLLCAINNLKYIKNEFREYFSRKNSSISSNNN